MQYDFDLAAVLSVTTGINCTNDFGEVFDLFCYIFEDDLLSPLALCQLKEAARRHILNIHPELKNVNYNPNVNIDEWVNKQKETFGNEIAISVIGEPIVKFEKQPTMTLK